MATTPDVMSSSADMIGAVDFSGTSFETPADTGIPESEPLDDNGNGIEDAPLDLEGIQPAESEGEIPEEPVADEPEPVVEPAQPDLPEGVREATVNGKKEMRLTPTRYETFHNAHKAMRDFEQMIGEPVTPDAFDVRNRAFIGQERLYTDLLSAEPEAQGKVLSHFIDEAQQALANGDVESDPTIPLGQAFYETLQAKAPDAYAHLRMRAAGDLVADMYAESQRTGDKNLAISASHVAKALGMSYKKDAEITQFLATPPANADPVANLRAENQRLQEQLNGRQATNATEQFQKWHGETVTAVTSGVLSDAVMPALSEERKAWEKFPTQFENLVVTPLNRAVRKTLSEDKNFATRIQLLELNARRASAQKRPEYAEQIKQAYVNRAKLAVDTHKQTVLREAAVLLKQGNDATHERRQAAQNQRGPRGPQNPAPHSLAPREVVNPGGVFDSTAEVARLSRLMGG